MLIQFSQIGVQNVIPKAFMIGRKSRAGRSGYKVAACNKKAKKGVTRKNITQNAKSGRKKNPEKQSNPAKHLSIEWS